MHFVVGDTELRGRPSGNEFFDEYGIQMSVRKGSSSGSIGNEWRQAKSSGGQYWKLNTVFDLGKARQPKSLAESKSRRRYLAPCGLSRSVGAKQADSYSTSKLNSLDAIAGGYISIQDDTETETEDDLFAVKLSPRSPEMKKSPFSFTAEDTAPWLAKASK